jgi:hypothetical protein
MKQRLLIAYKKQSPTQVDFSDQFFKVGLGNCLGLTVDLKF